MLYKAVLVAIAIPIFTTQLEKSREATDIANIRSAYAEAMADALADGNAGTYSAKTTNAQSTGTIDSADTSGITWFDLSTLNVTPGSPFIVDITVDSAGEATVTVSQS